MQAANANVFGDLNISERCQCAGIRVATRQERKKEMRWQGDCEKENYDLPGSGSGSGLVCLAVCIATTLLLSIET
jgi:hypothetical protein